MKKGNFFANCVFAVSVIFTVLSFSACTDDSNDVVATTSEVIEQAEVPFSVVLKAMNSDGNDITTKGEVMELHYLSSIKTTISSSRLM